MAQPDILLPAIEGEVKTTETEKVIVRRITISELGPIANVQVNGDEGRWVDRDVAYRVARAKDPKDALERARNNYLALTETGMRLFCDLVLEEYQDWDRQPLVENVPVEDAQGRVFVRLSTDDNTLWLPGGERPLSRVYAAYPQTVVAGYDNVSIDWEKVGETLTAHPWTVEWKDTGPRRWDNTESRWRWVFRVPQQIHDLWWDWNKARGRWHTYPRLAQVLLAPALTGDDFYLQPGEAGTIEGIGPDPLGLAGARSETEARSDDED